MHMVVSPQKQSSTLNDMKDSRLDSYEWKMNNSVSFLNIVSRRIFNIRNHGMSALDASLTFSESSTIFPILGELCFKISERQFIFTAWSMVSRLGLDALWCSELPKHFLS